MATPTEVVAYLALFFGFAAVFLLANLLIGKLLRPYDPHAEKQEIYECGEPPIGSSFVQFDLRFYVVALVFIVFDAEVAFLFPSLTVFGKQTQVADEQFALVRGGLLTPEAGRLYRELGVASPTLTKVAGGSATEAELRNKAQSYVWYTFGAVLVFFFILFVGFAYEWKTGAFDWVRALREERQTPPPARAPPVEEPVLSA